MAVARSDQGGKREEERGRERKREREAKNVLASQVATAGQSHEQMGQVKDNR